MQSPARERARSCRCGWALLSTPPGADSQILRTLEGAVRVPSCSGYPPSCPRRSFMKPQSRSLSSLRGLGAALALVGALVVAPRAARAHIKMSAPADWITTNSLGDPQKITPCGVDSTTTYTATNTVTTFHVGDKVTFNWTETVPHDGHFRISLAVNSRDELKDPAVTTMNSDGTAAAVAISTAYPVLADNLFPHTAASVSANKAYTYTVTIPNTPCAKCTLQLLQFMANHPLDPSYFYHQCADVTILGAGGSGGSGGSGVPTGGTGGRGGSGGSTGGTSGSGGAAGKSGGTGGAISGTGGAITGTGGSTTGAGGAITGTGGAGSGTGGATTGTGGNVASGSGGSAVGSGGSGAIGSGGTGTGTGGGAEGAGSSGGCSCQLGGANVELTGLGLLGVALICVRRHRRARR